MSFSSSRALADRAKSGGFFSRLFGRKEDSSMSDSDTVKISINVDVDDDDKKKSSARTASRSQTTSKQGASKKKADPNPPKKAASEHPRKSTHPSGHGSHRKKSAGVTTSRALEKRRRKHREMETEEDIGIAAFGSTKRRLGLRDEIADEENTDALMDALSDDVALDDCAYTEEEPQGMADKEPTEAQAAKLNRINERLRGLEPVLGEKYRAGYSSRSERGYVLRKYVGVSEKLETWGDPYLSRRPIGIGGKTLERVFVSKHGISWEEFARESATVRDIKAKIEKHNFTSTPNLRSKAETKALRERQAEEGGKAKAAKAEAERLRKEAERTKKEAEAKADAAKAQDQQAEKPQKTAKAATAKAKKEPRKTKAQAKTAESDDAALDKELLELKEMFA